MQTYIDIFAALVPAEVLAVHAIILPLATKIDQTSQPAVTSILASDVPTLSYTFYGLAVLSALLYLVPRWQGAKWAWQDAARTLMAPIAFTGWTMIQRTTAFDAVYPSLDQFPRTVIALFLALTVSAATHLLARAADAA